MTPPSPAAPLIVPLALPPAGLDPQTCPDHVLQEHGFPARPDPVRDPAAHAFWAAGFGPGTGYLPIKTEPASFRGHARLDAYPGALNGNWATSLNWSGFGVGAVQAQTIAGAAGTWTIPRRCDRPDEPPLDDIWRYSCWVGVDGVLPHASGLPQVGTDVTLHLDGTVTCRGWVQWYAPIKDDPAIEPLAITTFEVLPGDRIAAFVTVLGPDSVDLALVNLRRPQQPVAALIRLSCAGQPDPKRFAIHGTTAEWVLERPAQFSPGGIPPIGPTPGPFYPLPDFGTLRFEGLTVQQWDGPHAPESRRFQSDRALVQMSMFEQTHNPAALRTLTRPRLAGVGGQVRYWNARANETRWPDPTAA